MTDSSLHFHSLIAIIPFYGWPGNNNSGKKVVDYQKKDQVGPPQVMLEDQETERASLTV